MTPNSSLCTLRCSTVVALGLRYKINSLTSGKKNMHEVCRPLEVPPTRARTCRARAGGAPLCAELRKSLCGTEKKSFGSRLRARVSSLVAAKFKEKLHSPRSFTSQRSGLRAASTQARTDGDNVDPFRHSLRHRHRSPRHAPRGYRASIARHFGSQRARVCLKP